MSEGVIHRYNDDRMIYRRRSPTNQWTNGHEHECAVNRKTARRSLEANACIEAVSSARLAPLNRKHVWSRKSNWPSGPEMLGKKNLMLIARAVRLRIF